MSPKIIVEGPYDQDGNLNNFKHRLITTDSFNVSSETDAKRESIFGQEDDDAILSPVTGKRSARVEGETSFQAMNKEYPSLKFKNSVRRYLRGLEALVIQKQGLGWKVTDKVANRTFDPTTDRGFLISDMSWNFDAGDPGSVKWDLEFEQADGVQEGIDPRDYIGEQGYQDVGGDRVEIPTESLTIEFAEVDTRRLSRSVDIDSNDLIHQQEDSGGSGNTGNSPQLGTIKSGIETDVTFGGTAYFPNNFETKIKQFDNDLHGEEAILYDEFAGTTWIGTISDSSSTLNAGEPANRFEFSLDLVVGNVVTS